MTRPILYIAGPYSAGNGRTVADNIAVARRYSYRKIRICGVTGTTFRQTLQCPKLSKKNMDERTVSLAVDRPARTTTVLHE